ncbi:hypothetical protein K5549_011620 [Capra hircus]|nr:hypothetical protein K5549_011620 [Capra hircus]
MMENFLSTHRAISFSGCISQLHFFHFMGSTEAMLLAVMGFDRFVAICKPLHYTLIMNPQVCIQMALTVRIIGFYHTLLHSVMTSRLNCCGSNRIHHLLCDVKPLLELACGNTELNQWLVNTVTGTIAMAQVPSAQGKKKALTTCTSHLSMVILFYGLVFATYLKSPGHWGVEEMKLTYASEETL